VGQVMKDFTLTEVINMLIVFYILVTLYWEASKNFASEREYTKCFSGKWKFLFFLNLFIFEGWGELIIGYYVCGNIFLPL
jgi:hypothetical protein